jgi:hypothetical protein
MRKSHAMNSHHLQTMLPKSRADKSRCSNIQEGMEVVSVIVFRDVTHSAPRIEPAMNDQKSLSDPIPLSVPYVVESNPSPSPFVHFRVILDGFEQHFSPQAGNNLMLLARELGYDGQTATLGPRYDVSSHQKNVGYLLHELGRDIRGVILGADLLCVRDSLAVMQRDISVIRKAFNDHLNRILSEGEMLAKRVRLLSKTCQPDHRAFIEMPIEWLMLKHSSSLDQSPVVRRDGSTWAPHNYVVTAVFTDNAFNEVSMRNQLHIYSLSRQRGPPMMRLPCVAHTDDFTVGDFWRSRREPGWAIYKTSWLRFPTILAPLSAIFRGQKKSIGSAQRESLTVLRSIGRQSLTF